MPEKIEIKKIETKELTDEELKKVGGGFAGYNSYSKSEYHDAGFITDWAVFHPDYVTLNAGSGRSWGGWASCSFADPYVAYYKSHSLDEYVNWVRTTQGCTDYNYYRGYDMS